MSSSETLAARLRHGVAVRENWLQLVRFGIVGGTGYAVNLGVYAAAVHALGIDYRISAVMAFLVAVGNNFLLNRRWTFDGVTGRRRVQAARFLTVSSLVFGVTWVLLQLLVGAGLAEVPAQAIAVGVGTPVNFLGNKLWSFTQDGDPPSEHLV